MTGVVVGHPRRHALGGQVVRRPRLHNARIGLVAILVVVAGTLRIWWLFTHTYAIENDGAEYARIAENLIVGRGYVGLQPGPELLFPPLYPYAGRVLSPLFGSLLPLPVYLIGNRLYERRTAITATALVALSPLLIGYLTAVLSETTYITIQLAAAYLLLRANDKASFGLAVAAGACWVGPWTGRQWMRHGLLVLLGVANAAVFGAIAWYQFRFLLPLIPIALIFAARGCVRLADLASAAWVRNRPQRAPAAALAYLERVAPAVVVVADGVGAPYQSRWATSGLPDGNYRPVQTFNFDANPTVVYERASDT